MQFAVAVAPADLRYVVQTTTVVPFVGRAPISHQVAAQSTAVVSVDLNSPTTQAQQQVQPSSGSLILSRKIYASPVASRTAPGTPRATAVNGATNDSDIFTRKTYTQ